MKRLLASIAAVAPFTVLFIAIVAGPVALVAQGIQPAGKLDLFLLAGQSNMAGRGAVADLTAEEGAADPAVFALNRDGEWQPAMDPVHWDKAGAGVGPGKFFGRLVARQTPGAIVGLIPTACGGSPISAWEPGKYWEQTKSHPWNDAIARTRRAMRDGTLRAIIWHQGESDGNARNAAHYEQRLTDLIARFRAEFDDPDLPFIIGQLGKFEAEGVVWNEHKTEVDRAQRAVAAKVPHVYFVMAAGLGSKGDKLHFSTAAQKVLGEGYAEAYLRARLQK